MWYIRSSDDDPSLPHIRLNERFPRSILNDAPCDPHDAWSSLPDGSVEFANQRWHDYTGLSDEELRGWGWKVAVHPDDLETVIGKWQALITSR
jgi:PAS domain-containing protein